MSRLPGETLGDVEYAEGMFKPGDLVRHRNMSDWGLGRVSGEMGDGKVLIKFTARKGDVLLSQDGAEKFLVLDPTAVWTATPTTKVRRPPATGRSASRSSARPVPVVPLMPSPFTKQPPRRIPCVNCAAPLSSVVSSADGAWRSCPSCSSRSGRHHVFLPYPAAFDVPADVPVPPIATEAADESDAAPAEPEDPHAGWCRACLAGELATGYKTCMKVL